MKILKSDYSIFLTQKIDAKSNDNLGFAQNKEKSDQILLRARHFG